MNTKLVVVSPGVSISLGLSLGFLLMLALLVSLPAKAESAATSFGFGRWSVPQLMTDGGAYSPVMRTAPNGTTILVYGKATMGTGSQINPTYQLLPAGSTAWSASAPIHTGLSDYSQVTLAFNSASVAHAIWRSNNTVFYARQDQWTSNSFATVLAGAHQVLSPQIAIGDDDIIHVVATQNSAAGVPHNIYHTYSTDGGHSWNNPITELATSDRNSSTPAIAVDANGNVYVVWGEAFFQGGADPFIYRVYYRSGTKSGNNYVWSAADTFISGALQKAQLPAILIEGNTLQVTFTNVLSANEQYIYYVRRPADSANWTVPVNITGSKPLAVNTNAPGNVVTNLVGCQGQLHVFYYGNEVADANERLFGQENRNGVWQSRETVSDDSARRIRPSAVCRDNMLYLAYEQIVNLNDYHQVYTSFAYERILLPIILRN